MSTTTLEPRQQHEENGSALVVRPQQGGGIGALAEQQRAIAEIQSALTVAKAQPRAELACVDRIMTACQRVGLAEKAEYSYSRGGSEITGPTIDLMTTIAMAWGNLQFGFRELSQSHNHGQSESLVEAFAWDLESNAKRTVVFSVPHKRVTKNGSYPLTDPRDIYEMVANYAQRRVRACLEAVIPPDIVEDAVGQCRATLQAKAKVTPESIGKMVQGFAAFGVTKEQIEKRLGRRLDAMQPAQLLAMHRVYKSIVDGVGKPSDWFEMPEESKAGTATDAVKEALKKRAAPAKVEEPTTPAEAEAVPDQTNREAGQDEDLELLDIANDLPGRIASFETDLESNAIGADMLRVREMIGEEKYKVLMDQFTARNRERAAMKKGVKKGV